MRFCLSVLFISVFAGPAAAGPIELAPGLWSIESEETQDVANEGRIGSRPPMKSSELRCLDEQTAWLNPADYAESFTSRGCRQQTLTQTPLNFEGIWACQVNDLNLTINMSGESSLTGDTYSTLMTVTGRNSQTSVNVRTTVAAKRTGDCPESGEYSPPSDALTLRGR